MVTLTNRSSDLPFRAGREALSVLLPEYAAARRKAEREARAAKVASTDGWEAPRAESAPGASPPPPCLPPLRNYVIICNHWPDPPPPPDDYVIYESSLTGGIMDSFSS